MTPDQAPTAPLKAVRRCGHWLDGHRCETADGTVRFYLVGDRCSAHTPAACAGRPESVPDPSLTLVGLRTVAGIAANFVAPMAAGALIDDRAVASGRRRSSQETFHSARSAEQTRKDREKATRRGTQPPVVYPVVIDMPGVGRVVLP